MDKTQGSGAGTFSIGGLRLDGRATIILVVTTLLLLVDHYHTFLRGSTYAEAIFGKAIERTVYYLVIPLIIILLGFRDKPSEYGFTVGNWREGLKWTALIMLVAAPILYLSARSPGMVEYYSRFSGDLGHLLPTVALDLVGWEFIFRGFMLFGLMRLMGPTAVIVQAVPFALAHMGKPELETMSTIFGGALFGLVAWRGRSFVYPFLIHLFIYTFVVLVAQG